MNVDTWTRCSQFLFINGIVRSLCYIRYQMGYIIVYCTCWVLDRALHTKETLSDFIKLWILVNRILLCGIELHDIHRFSTG